MIRQIQLTVEPQTLSTTPDEYEIKLGKGTLTHVRVRPAVGPNWEVYTRLLHLQNSIIPDEIDQWIPLEGESLDFYPNFNDWSGIYKVKIQICSPQARFAHTVQYDLTLDEQANTPQLLERLLSEGF